MPGLVVQNNMNAINANNKLGMNVIGTKKATEKLSSGFAINRAGDNAAGLAISEKMRSQIRGLAQAINNANDGISLIQTAEGGLNETHAILQRMRELAVQSANGTYQDEDRAAIQLEVDALKSEIDRIAASTEYNKIKLLDGSLGGGSSASGMYGPKYGFLVDNDASLQTTRNAGISAGTVVTSSINGVKVSFTTQASGANAANAFWNEDGNELTINLNAGTTYTQAQIDELIKNATQQESGDSSTGQVAARPELTVKLGTGVITLNTAADITTELGTRSKGVGVDLQPFLVDDGGVFGTENYANGIQFTSNNYGADTRVFSLATSVDRGKEWVEITTPETDPYAKNGTFTIHLATGTEYTEGDIEAILRKAGLDYSIELYSTNPPDDGETKFFANRKIDPNAGDTAIAVGTMGTAGTGFGGRDGVVGLGVGKDNSVAGGEGLTFQIGANGVADQRVSLSVENMSAGAIGVANADVSTREAANAAIETVDKAVSKVSFQRAGLGALQNRLEYTVNNLTVTNENLTAAESQIRDTDMAKEMINYTKFTILQQAAQAMLAQANQAPQAVLQLLG